MKKLITTLLLLQLFSIAYSQSIDQQVFSSSGESISNGNNTLNYTVGEPIVKNITAASNTVDPGFWATGALLVLSVDDFVKPIPEAQIFPNPVQDYLNIRFSENVKSDYEIQVFDLSGKKQIEDKIVNGDIEKRINLQNFTPGTYIILVTDKNSSNAISYKIIKN